MEKTKGKLKNMTQYSLKNKRYLTISIFILILVWQTAAIIVDNRLLLPSFFNVLSDIYTIQEFAPYPDLDIHAGNFGFMEDGTFKLFDIFSLNFLVFVG